MYLYVANITAQTRGICYRDTWNPTPGIKSPFRPSRKVDIPPGRQLQVAGDSDLPKIEEIIRQLEPFGMFAVTDVGRLTHKDRVVLIWNIDKPVPEAVLKAAQDHNRGIAQEDGEKRRTMAAIAANSALIQQVANLNDTPGLPVQLKDPSHTDVEFEQMEDIGEDDPRIEVGIKVDNTAPAAPRAPRGRRAAGG